ncbi:MAG: EAL domain-containing protein [Pseudomonadota bacterium]
MLKSFTRYARENPLGNRVLTAILFSSTCLACVATAVQLFVDYRHNMSGIELRMVDIKRSYPRTLADSLWNVDTQQTHTQIQGIASLPDIVSVQLKDAEGKMIEKAGAEQVNNALVVTQAFPIEYKKDASAAKVFLGTLVVTASVERIYTEIRNKAFIILGSQTAKTTLVAIFSLFIFNYLVSQHLSTVAAYARMLDLKHLDKILVLSRPPTKHPDELDVVVSAFNIMANSIKRDYEEIEKHKANLEILVDNRTQALAQKIAEKEEVITELNHEIQERLLAEREALNNEQRYRQLVEMLPDAIIVEVDQKITFFNDSTLTLLQAKTPQDIYDKSVIHFIPPEWHIIIKEHLKKSPHNKRMFECKLFRCDGSTVNVEMSQAIFYHKGQLAVQTVIHDITKHKHYEEQLLKQALHDALTGLPNRLLLSDRIENEINMAERLNQSVYIIFLDLDRFKYVNDTLGHDVGDSLLKTIAEKMAACLRKSDTLARLGGDEFVIVMGRISEEAMVFKFINRLIEAISSPNILNNHEITISASIGVSNYPNDGDDAVTLLKHADSAMYQAKLLEPGGVQQYSKEMHARVNEHLVMESRLHHAIERQELMLHYQPLLNLKTGHIVGAEALIRWNHPTLGLVPPLRFIPLAEETGLIVPIGKWVIRTACTQAKLWQEQGLPFLRISVNLSVQQLIRPGLENELEQILKETGLEPQYLELEITESASMVNPKQMIQLLQNLKAMGLKLAIDDFGTGYSNLSYLKELPVDHLKLDRVFVRDIVHSPKDAMLIRSMIEIAHNLDLNVIAEGVEEISQLKELKLYGCDEMQGYYFNPPVPVDVFEKIVSNHKPDTFGKV